MTEAAAPHPESSHSEPPHSESAHSEAPRPEPAPFIDAWAESLAQVLGQIRGSAFPCTVLAEIPAEMAPASEQDLWIMGATTGGLRGEMSLRIPAISTARLARIFMGEPAAPAAGSPEVSPEHSPELSPEHSPEHREAALELLRQVSGLVVSALKPRWGEVQLRLDASSGPPSWPASATVWLRAGEDLAAALLELHLSAALGAALRAVKTEPARPAHGDVSTGVSAGVSDVSRKPLESAVKLDLLMDVELGLTLRFGSRRLLLREVLDLIPGSVIDLDRQVQEPVDVLLDGRVVARGEIVVMEGNYGLQVTEVAPAGI
jgi:flagellar motor switch protein FliN